MVHGHGGVVFGSETSGGIRNVVISNCVFTGTDRGIRFKSRRGRGGVVEDVRVTNIVMVGVLCPFTMNLYYAPGARGNKEVSDKKPHPVTAATPRFRRIHLSHITARQAQYAAAFLFGLAEMPVEDVSFSDISVAMSPDAEAGYPDMAEDLELMQRAGFFVRNAHGLRLHNVEVTGQRGPALLLSDVADVDISACSTRTPDAGEPVIRMKDVDGAFVHGCLAHPGTETFLQLEGENTREIVLGNNNLSRARRPVNLTGGARPDVIKA